MKEAHTKTDGVESPEAALQREHEYESDNQQKYAGCYRSEQKFIHPKGMPERLFCSEYPNRGLWHPKLFDGELGNLRGVLVRDDG